MGADGWNLFRPGLDDLKVLLNRAFGSARYAGIGQDAFDGLTVFLVKPSRRQRSVRRSATDLGQPFLNP